MLREEIGNFFDVWEDMHFLNRCKWAHICPNKDVRCSMDRKLCVFSENNIIFKFLLWYEMYARDTQGSFFLTQNFIFKASGQFGKCNKLIVFDMKMKHMLPRTRIHQRWVGRGR